MDARQPSPKQPAALDNLLAHIAQRIGTPEATLEQLCRASAAEALEWVAPKLAPWDANLPTLIREWADQIEAGTLTPHGPRQQTRPGNRAERHGDAMKPPTPTHTEVRRLRTAPARRHAEEASDE